MPGTDCDKNMYEMFCSKEFAKIGDLFKTVFIKLDKVGESISGNGTPGIKERLGEVEVLVSGLRKDASDLREVTSKKTMMWEQQPRIDSKKSFVDAISDWRTIAVAIVMIAWAIASTANVFRGTPALTPEQFQQISQQIRQVSNQEKEQ